MRNSVISAAILFVLAAAIPRSATRLGAQATRPDRGTPGKVLVNARFALKDATSTDWSGTLEVTEGRLEKLEGWHFPPLPGPNQAGPRCQITGPDSWEAQSLLGQVPNVHVDLSPVLPAPRPVWPVGILVFLTGDSRTKLNLRFKHHESVSLSLGELDRGPAQFRDGAIEIERLPELHRIGGDAGEADYPSIAVTRSGTVWVAWQEYRGGSERVLARSLSGDTWSAAATLSESGDVYRTAVAEAGDGRVLVVWAAREAGSWHLWGRSFDGANWSRAEKLSEAPGLSFHHRLAADSKGRLWLVWQGFDRGQSDIFLRIYQNGSWTAATRISETGSNDWEPSVAVDSQGRGWIVWDTYRAARPGAASSYDVVARTFRDGILSPVMPVAASARMEAHASITLDDRGRPWIAYDEAGENWGKDWGFLSKDRGIGLYMSRTLRVVCLDGDKVLEPEQDIQGSLPLDMQLYSSLPSIHADGSGRIWVVFRYLAGARTRTADLWGAGGGWENAAMCYTGSRWERPIALARSLGRNDGRPAAAPMREGVAAAYASDHRPFLGGLAQDYGVYATQVSARPAPAAELRTRVRSVPATAQLPAHPAEAEDVRRIRSYRAQLGRETYRIVRGDLHRHTDISGDGIGDGSLLDLYRYALDAAALDFIAVTDHGAGNDLEYSWWRTQKSSDLFMVPDAFTPLFGYERSLPYPNGHRNIVFDHRGVRTLPSSLEERQGKEGAAKLYQYLRENDGIAFAHTIATNQGTDWRDNDPALEPLVEIYQGFRNSYEYEGSPKSATADRPYLFKSGYQPLGFYWNALAKGYKLGIQASSDHVSTHLSYSCLYVTGLSRRELMDAMRARRTYGATDNILLDYRLVDADGTEHLMGASVAITAAPKLKVHAIGTSPIQRVDIIKNNRYVYTVEPGKPESDFTFTDSEAATGDAYYYVRVLQYDGQLAWSSPIWVTRK